MALKRFQAKWVPVQGANSAKVDTGFAPEFAPKFRKNAFALREPVTTSLENAFEENASEQQDRASILIQSESKRL